MSDPSSKPTINIPAGNSPVTPEPTGPVAPTRYLHGSEPSPDDYKAAIAVSRGGGGGAEAEDDWV